MYQVLAATILALVAVVGWLVASAQQRESVQLNMKIDYLLKAYRNLERATYRKPTNELYRLIEDALADVYLLGTSDQIELVNAIYDGIDGEQGDGIELDKVLRNLRDSLRKELHLEQVASDRKTLRLGDIP